jgi:hypothetical protein
MTTNQSPIEPTYKEKVDDILLRAIAKWEAQGRSEDEKWAVRNFETGTMIEAKRQLTTLLLEAENKGGIRELGELMPPVNDMIPEWEWPCHICGFDRELLRKHITNRIEELTKGTHE